MKNRGWKFKFFIINNEKFRIDSEMMESIFLNHSNFWSGFVIKTTRVRRSVYINNITKLGFKHLKWLACSFRFAVSPENPIIQLCPFRAHIMCTNM